MKKKYQTPRLSAFHLLQASSLLTVSGEISGYGRNTGRGFSQDPDETNTSNNTY
ncbi:MAG: hypothetical protein IJ615_07220 [Bacteroidaceae bacterium]|nr:hypothetical protein [Bacteroidaceae bacterium]